MKSSLSLDKKRFVICGRPKAKSRNIIAKLELAGAKCCLKVSTKTDYIVIADTYSPSLRKKILDEIQPLQSIGKCVLIEEDELARHLGL